MPLAIRRLTFVAGVMLTTCMFPAIGRAVIVAGGDGSQNTTAPLVDDFGFAKVGRVFDTMDGVFIGGVYLGEGWVLSAYHGVRDASGTGFLFGSVSFGSEFFTVDATSAVRLTTPGQGNADLALFHLFPPYPSVAAAALAASTPAAGSTLAMLGNGRNRDTIETRWNVNTATNPDTWTETAGPGDRQGYKWAAGSQLRWGMNARTADALSNVNNGFGITRMFRTQFDNDGSAIASEAQGSPGDSGGGVFYKNGSTWELAGIMLTVSTPLDGQPAETTVFGSQTFSADVAAYRAQINATIPEPSAAALLAVAAGALLSQRRRR